MVAQHAFPGSKPWIKENMEFLLPAVGALMLWLRMKTREAVFVRRKDKIS